jgi:SHS2 domain-containing protein
MADGTSDPGPGTETSGRSHDHFEHEADVGVRGLGPSKAAAFEAVAEALTEVIPDLDRVRPSEAVTVACSAPDEELLLVEWLNALVYEMATRKMLFSRFTVEIDGLDLKGEARGEPVDVARHRPAAEVKGATFTALEVTRQDDGRWRAQCVVDV